MVCVNGIEDNINLYWSYWWLYEPSESTGSEPVIYRTRSFSFFTVYHHVDILGLNELLFSFPPVLELQHKRSTLVGGNTDLLEQHYSFRCPPRQQTERVRQDIKLSTSAKTLN